ncbi:flavin reductase family protein [Acidocella sp.]|uniref:flavin reductase family protein n=1 Tax=Acidocella sp. TaxID=50710 RepID=UPI002632AD96|nr:flavin reductase family protein [Acidocella sp.]
MSTEINQLIDWQPNPALSGLDLVSPEAHRFGMRHFAAGVTILATGDNQERAGLTATAVVSVTADPPRLVAFVNKNVAAAELILRLGNLSVNVLADDQEDIARAFAGMMKDVHGPARFGFGDWGTAASGAPVLVNALTTFDTRVIKLYDESTHYAALCEVLATRERVEAKPLLYFNGGFHRLRNHT